MLKLSALCICGLLLLMGQHAVVADEVAQRPVRIAIVDVAKLLANAPQSKAADAKLKVDFVPREQNLEADKKVIRQLEDDLAVGLQSGVLPGAEKVERQRELRDLQRNYARAMEDFREEVRLARDSAIDTLQAEIVQAIVEVREREKIDLVLRESNYIVASDRIDITATVMQHLEQKFQAQTAATPVPGKQE
ncbi:OmpH family outer membrane protein [Thiothrix winogradskyi]|uniref:OmpH family outer membrane protein n=1 Tax=Thiothrix winogradskyi TaxID=96472 RepID=A0ABY3SWU9_9GAMM|nr:OmpH family outer membrane protein [Thiothrix winogradskyi]UJS23977.1 OmpH family outer membrane protein [Thiothrix winogradskyi]